METFETLSNVHLGQLEHLSDASVIDGDITEAQSPFIIFPLVPVVEQAKYEQFGSDVRLRFPAECVDRLMPPDSVSHTPFPCPLDKLQLDERAIKIIFLNISLSPARRRVRMEEDVEVLLQESP